MPKFSRVLLLNGVVVSGDAISRSLTMKREALLEAYGDNVEISIATYASNLGLPNTFEVTGLVDLIHRPAFRDADLFIYEFGVFYDFFDSVRLTPPGAKRLAVWHNITPPGLATSAQSAKLLERSLDQRSNLLTCDHVFCDSEFNADELQALRPAAGQTSVLKLPVGASFAGVGAKRRSKTGEVRLLYVGRIVPAKGVLDLVHAFTAASATVSGIYPTLDIVGNIAFSDHAYVDMIKEISNNSNNRINLIGRLDDVDLVEAYRNADIVVIPSYHEGYCVPVLEAYAAGCHVIAYDAGNLPYIVGDHGLTLTTGDVEALTAALASEFRERHRAYMESREPVVSTNRGPVGERERRDIARRYVADYGEGAYRERFISAIERLYELETRAADR